VLRSLSLNRIERLMGALMEQPDFELVRFENQPSGGGAGVPDAVVASSCLVLVETKRTRNAIDRDQLERHLNRLEDASERVRCLLVLTPDENRPAKLAGLPDPDGRLNWASFAALDQAIDDLLADKTEVVSEREAFLLRELQAMLLEEDLLSFEKDTVVVAARQAWAEYNQLHAYVCQPGRRFQPVKYVGFYADGKIQRVVPLIVAERDHVRMERGLHKDAFGPIVERLLDLGLREPFAEHKVLLLSAPDDPQTVRLDAAIVNDLRSTAGRVTAYTQGQRYVRLDDLRRAKRTSDLVESGEPGLMTDD